MIDVLDFSDVVVTEPASPVTLTAPHSGKYRIGAWAFDGTLGWSRNVDLVTGFGKAAFKGEAIDIDVEAYFAGLIVLNPADEIIKSARFTNGICRTWPGDRLILTYTLAWAVVSPQVVMSHFAKLQMIDHTFKQTTDAIEALSRPPYLSPGDIFRVGLIQ